MEENREQQIKEVEEKNQEAINIEEFKKIVSDNKIEFDIDGITYRSCKPNFKQKQEVYKKRCEKHVELLEEKKPNGTFKYLDEEGLKALHKLRGTDIDHLRKILTTLFIKRDELKGKLGKAIKENNSQKEIDVCEKDFIDCQAKIDDISNKINSLLEFSIENQLLVYIFNYFTFITTEKKIVEEGKEDKWIRAWNSYDDFLNEKNDILLGSASTYLTALMSDQIV